MSQPSRSTHSKSWHSYSVALGIAILLIGLLQISGAASSLDNWLYDQCVSLPKVREETPPAVLLISSSSEILESEQYRNELVNQLQDLGATGIAFTIPFQENAPVVTPPKQNSAWMIVPDRYFDPRTWQNSSVFGFADEHDQIVFVGFSPATDGIVRSQRMEFSDESEQGLSLEAAIAQRWFGGRWTAPDEKFLINYSNRDSAMPTVSAEFVLSDGLVPELVRNRVVLIGLERDLSVSGIVGPIQASVPMTPLEVHGFAVNSLLTQTWNSALATRLTISLAVLSSVVIFVFSARYPQQRRRFVVTFLLTELVIGWMALSFAHIWISVGVLWIAQISFALSSSVLSRWQWISLIERAVYHLQTRSQLQKMASAPSKTDSVEWSGTGDRTEKHRLTANLSSRLFHGLDCLNREMDLLEQVFNQAGTGIALYDEDGVLTRVNQSLRTFLTQQFTGVANSSLERVQTAVNQVLRENTRVSITVPVQDRSTPAQVHARPIDFKWSSPFAPVNSIEVLRTKFVICEWNLSHEATPIEASETSQESAAGNSKPSEHTSVELVNSSAGPSDEDFATVMSDFTETRTLHNPFQNGQIPQVDSAPYVEEEFEAVAERSYE